MDAGLEYFIYRACVRHRLREIGRNASRYICVNCRSTAVVDRRTKSHESDVSASRQQQARHSRHILKRIERLDQISDGSTRSTPRPYTSWGLFVSTNSASVYTAEVRSATFDSFVTQHVSKWLTRWKFDWRYCAEAAEEEQEWDSVAAAGDLMASGATRTLAITTESNWLAINGCQVCQWQEQTNNKNNRGSCCWGIRGRGISSRAATTCSGRGSRRGSNSLQRWWQQQGSSSLQRQGPQQGQQQPAAAGAAAGAATACSGSSSATTACSGTESSMQGAAANSAATWRAVATTTTIRIWPANPNKHTWIGLTSWMPHTYRFDISPHPSIHEVSISDRIFKTEPGSSDWTSTTASEIQIPTSITNRFLITVRYSPGPLHGHALIKSIICFCLFVEIAIFLIDTNML